LTEKHPSTKQPVKRSATPRAPRGDKSDEESAVLAKIAAMPEPFRGMGERLHTIIKASAPALTPKLWYGMPAYAKAGKCVCFFRADSYLTLGFTEQANLFDEGSNMQPSSFALKNLTAAEEAMISKIVKKAVS